MMFHPRSQKAGFTLIELIVVLAIISLMLSIALPKYFHSMDVAKESTLKQNLSVMRETIDKYYGDKGVYPDSLEELVEQKYIRAIPVDPMTESASSWRYEAPQESESGKIYNIRSGSESLSLNGTRYQDL